MQINQIHVLGVLSDPLLNLRTALINDAQIGLVDRRGAVQNLVHKAQALFRAELLHAVDPKILEHRRILRAHRHDHILR